MKPIVAALAAVLAGGAIAADDPTASLNRPFAEYTGAGPIGNNNLNTGTLYWMHESSGVWMGQNVESWFLIWDPYSNGVRGSIEFDGAILGVMDERAELIGTAGLFGRPGVTYDYSRGAVGLEATDRANTSFLGEVLTLSWNASNPGDHVRVFTAAVPEPQTYALMLAGLAAVGFMARRRRTD